MKRKAGILLALALVLILSTAQAVTSEDLAGHQVSALESAGVPVYPGSVYLTGDDEVATIMWFSSDDSPDEIMDWYKAQLDGWSEIEVNGTRAIYQGPPGVASSELSAFPYVFARVTDESGVEPDSEITVRIPVQP